MGTCILSIHGRVGYQNKGLGAVPGYLEPLGCVSFANAVMRVKPRRSCFIRVLLKFIWVQWGSGALCWLSLTVLCLQWPVQRERLSGGHGHVVRLWEPHRPLS